MPIPVSIIESGLDWGLLVVSALGATGTVAAVWVAWFQSRRARADAVEARKDAAEEKRLRIDAEASAQESQLRAASTIANATSNAEESRRRTDALVRAESRAEYARTVRVQGAWQQWSDGRRVAGDNFAIISATVTNGGDEGIHDVRIWLALGWRFDDPWTASEVPNTWANINPDNAPYRFGAIASIAGRESAISEATPTYVFNLDYGAPLPLIIEFTDSSDNRWRRMPNGELVLVDIRSIRIATSSERLLTDQPAFASREPEWFTADKPGSHAES